MTDFPIPERAKRELADQPSLFDPEAGTRLREEAIERVERGADVFVVADAHRAVRATCAALDEFTADDVWERMDRVPAEPRVMGPVMRWAATEGLAAPTDRHRLSKLPQNHRRPMRIWRSLR